MFINLHTHQKDDTNFTIFNAFLESVNINCSYGIHPWYVNQYSSDSLSLLENLIQQENCLAIGECGLDKLSEVAWEKQMTFFEAQILLSEKYQKPLIIHCVKAFQELIVLKRKYQPKQAWILHGFSKSNVAKQLLAEGFYLSIGANLITSEKLQETLKTVPLNRLFLETDDKGIAISDLYCQLSKIKKLDVSELERQLEVNFLKAFRREPESQKC